MIEPDVTKSSRFTALPAKFLNFIVLADACIAVEQNFMVFTLMMMRCICIARANVQKILPPPAPSPSMPSFVFGTSAFA